MAFLAVSSLASDETTLNKLILAISKKLEDTPMTIIVSNNNHTINFFRLRNVNSMHELTISIRRALLEKVKNTAPKVKIINSPVVRLLFCKNIFIKNRKNNTKKAPAKLGSKNTENILCICSSQPK